MGHPARVWRPAQLPTWRSALPSIVAFNTQDSGEMTGCRRLRSSGFI